MLGLVWLGMVGFWSWNILEGDAATGFLLADSAYTTTRDGVGVKHLPPKVWDKVHNRFFTILIVPVTVTSQLMPF